MSEHLNGNGQALPSAEPDDMRRWYKGMIASGVDASSLDSSADIRRVAERISDLAAELTREDRDWVLLCERVDRKMQAEQVAARREGAKP